MTSNVEGWMDRDDDRSSKSSFSTLTRMTNHLPPHPFTGVETSRDPIGVHKTCWSDLREDCSRLIRDLRHFFVHIRGIGEMDVMVEADGYQSWRPFASESPGHKPSRVILEKPTRRLLTTTWFCHLFPSYRERFDEFLRQ
jgi:hypothetical protein